MHVNMNKTVASAFYAGCNKMRTSIKMCFHALHFKCYFDNIKKSGKCLLCSKVVNCAIPIRYDPKQTKVNRVCHNIVLFALHKSYEIYDI